ncbi:MAG TPA: FliM/FliN family flagellar motor switch protein [Trinickia sp.]|uniref:FliM/FliN family flagellar motor switch protein n=1 Tax=Trinickia sp. TaxID=2571163 RepID=UPI002BE339DD|nr:FliM/FliN family flagellar motor switch protein [Trinickia sp.]HVW50446.1 FliM/FliN family flagellar motor switch protein [Trinickia sp.]
MFEARPTSLNGKLPRYSSELAQLARALGVNGSTHPGATHGLRLQGMGASPGEQNAMMIVDTAHGPVTLVIDVADHTALQTIAHDCDPVRASALANLWLGDLLARFDTGNASTPVVRSFELTRNAGAHRGLLLSFIAAGAECRCTVLELPAALAAHFERCWARPGERDALDTLEDLTLACAIRLRSRRCAPDVLASLQCNDILLGWQPTLPYGPGKPLAGAMLRIGAPRGRQLCAAVRVDTNIVTLETPVTLATAQPDDFDPLEGAPAHPKSEPLVPVSSMELPVHVELFSVNLGIAQVGALQPGYVLDLPLPLDDAAVRLVSYGQTLAFGKLVAVGENLGVQIERMAASDERQS